MPNRRRLLPYWRRTIPCAKFDISKLRPPKLPRGDRFETQSDARAESVRSEAALACNQPSSNHGTNLRECRVGDYHCEKAYCPICARTFRRYLTAELLRLHSGFDGKVSILVVLLERSPKGEILKLDIDHCCHRFRKRLERAGLTGVPVIGGFEIIYRAREKQWMLHVNLVIFGGSNAAIRKFAGGFPEERAVRQDDLIDPVEQLSYVLKFTTYHRPYEQRGPKKSRAMPLNPLEHFELVRWMAQYTFTDHLFLFNARRRGATIELSSKAARKA
jgi:hypothetical protein